MRGSILKPHAGVFATLVRVVDPALAVAVGVVFYHVYLAGTPSIDRYLVFLALAAAAVTAIFPLLRLYEPQRGASLADETRRLVLAWTVVGALAAGALFVTKAGDLFSRVWFVAWLAGSFAGTVAVRIGLRLGLRLLRAGGRNLRHVAIVGAGRLGRQVAARLQGASWAGLNVVAVYDDDPGKRGSLVAGVEVAGPADAVTRDVRTKGIDQVWIALPLRAEARVRELLTALRDYPVDVRFVPDIYGFHLLNHSVTEVAGLPVISLTETPMSGVNEIVKRLLDLVLAVLAVIVLSPVMLAVATGVKLSSPGPVLFRQRRVTWNGDEFEMLKFRTMRVGAEDRTGPVFAHRGDARATPFGAFLRRFSLDELPQLFNVLRGQMSLVGPRPERPEFVERFRREIPGYMLKHLVKGGMTGWAQVNDLRGDSDLRRRIEYDLFYIENWSVWFDLRILALTVARVLFSRNAY